MDDANPTPPLPKPPQASGFRKLLVWLGIVVVIGAAAVVLRGAPRPGDPAPGARGRAAVSAPAPAPAPAGDPNAGEDEVARALRLAAIDSTKKNEWVDEIPDLDVSMLSAAQLATFTRLANMRRCSCGCGFTLAACRRFDSTCDVSGPRVEALRDSVAKGLLADARGTRERPPGAPR